MIFTNVVYAALAQSLAVSAATMQVTVGANNQFTFTPNSVTAQPGDTVNFNFVSQNHSVASSKASTPCQPENNAIFSDFQPVSGAATAKGKKGKGKAKNNIVNARAGNMPTFSVPVTDSQPMYIYCSQAQHCQQGMVMVINPPATGATVKAYQQAAAKARNNVSPTGGVSGGTVTNSAAGKNAKAGKAKAAGDAAAGKAKAAGGAAAGGAAAGGAGGALAGLLGGKGKGNN